MAMDWDDYKYFSALAATRSVRAAAQQLDVNPSTVSRRLEQFEARLGVPLFTRSKSGLTITPEGAEVIAQVDEIADNLGNIESRLVGRDQRLSGVVRVVIPEVIALSLLVRELPRFRLSYPDIEVQLVPGHQTPDLSRREVDIAIEVTDHPLEMMVGRRLSPTAFAAYGTEDLINARRNGDFTPDLSGKVLEPWVDFRAASEVAKTCRELRHAYVPDVLIAVRCNSLLLHLEAARQGLGFAFLPCILAESDPSLFRLHSLPAKLGPSMWMLTHPDLRKTQRILVFMEFVRDLFKRRSHELLGAELAETEAFAE